MKDSAMEPLRLISRAIDALNRRIGRFTVWFILASVLISAGNASMRKAFGLASNAWLEGQWYLFAAAFLLASGYVLMVDEHVRVDALAQRFSPRLRAWIDVLALVLAVLPLCVLMVGLGAEYFWRAWTEGERSFNSDGLVRWPVRLCIPLGFALLGLQSLSEIIKRMEFLQGRRTRATTCEADLPEFMGPAPVGSPRP
ncbi:MAG: TRAP transporter small permease subunit [Ramlibacter sp.]|nr:TRAP transporter small permease subunit [Ramlibacter sp.]